MARFLYQIKAEPLGETQPTETRWFHPVYPDLILRRWIAAAAQQAFATGNTQPDQYFDVTQHWRGHYPDAIRRSWMPAALQQASAIDGQVRPTVDLLQAWAVAPDRILRRSLHASLMPSFAYGSWDPLPNPPSTYVVEDHLVLGQHRSLDVPTYPQIGGSQTWS